MFSGENVLKRSPGAHLWGRMTLLLVLSWAELGWALLPAFLAWKDHLAPKNWKELDLILQSSPERPSG